MRVKRRVKSVYEPNRRRARARTMGDTAGDVTCAWFESNGLLVSRRLSALELHWEKWRVVPSPNTLARQGIKC